MTADNPSQLTRRSVLAGLGAIGAASMGGRYVRAALGQNLPYTQYTYAQSTDEEVDLRVAWYETYNGTLVERTPDTVVAGNQTTWETAAQLGEYADADGSGGADHGPVVTIADVLPGDRGSLVVGLFNEGVATDVWLQFTSGDFTENGRNEPERIADYTTDGELGDAVNVQLWYDVGVGGIGACNGTYDLDVPLGGQTLNEPLIQAGTLQDVGTTLADGRQLNPTPRSTSTDCMRSGATMCLGLAWTIDDAVGNRIQSDGATFDLQFAAVDCRAESGNPFTSGESQ